MNKVVQEAIARLEQLAERPLREFRDAVTDELCVVTGSELSYLAAMNLDESVLTMIGWSQAAMAACAIGRRPLVYRLEDTGLWGDAVRERGPVITNNYPALSKATKKGYPAGHVEVVRHMNLPIMSGDRISMVVGVANKPQDYTEKDVQNAYDLMMSVHDHVERSIAEGTW